MRWGSGSGGSRAPGAWVGLPPSLGGAAPYDFVGESLGTYHTANHSNSSTDSMVMLAGKITTHTKVDDCTYHDNMKMVDRNITPHTTRQARMGAGGLVFPMKAAYD